MSVSEDMIKFSNILIVDQRTVCGQSLAKVDSLNMKCHKFIITIT